MKTHDNMHYFKDLTANIFRSDSCFSKIEIKKKYHAVGDGGRGPKQCTFVCHL